MAAIREKIAPRHYSYMASAVGVVVALGLWYFGSGNQRTYLVSMAESHHNGYGTPVDCRMCHVPTGWGFGTEMNCLTARCHGELKPETPREEARQIYVSLNFDDPKVEESADRFFKLHEIAADQNCWDCHSEHTEKYVPRPPASAFQTSALGERYISISQLLEETG